MSLVLVWIQNRMDLLHVDIMDINDTKDRYYLTVILSIFLVL